MSISTVYKIINDIDEKVYIGSTTCKISKRMTEHRRNSRQAIRTSKLYNHMRAIGVQHFKIVCIREYTDISKERLHNREEKYIKRYDSIKNGLNTNSMGGYYCIHDKLKRYCVECEGPAMCIHEKRRKQCKICSPALCDRCGGIYAGKGNLKKHQLKCQIDQSTIYPQ